MNNSDTGLLLNKNNIKLHRDWFKQMTNLLGIKVIYRAPRESKQYNGHGELESFYYEPIELGAIYDEHPNQRTMRKMGWDSELNDTSTIIHVPYDLEGLQVGALFDIPSGLDDAVARRFRVIKMHSIAVYPASITCELAPMWQNGMERTDVEDFTKTNFNVLIDPEDAQY